MTAEALQHRILVIGCGSIGERHVRAFLATRRCQVVAADIRPEVCQQIAVTYHVHTAADWSELAEGQAITGAIVATPAPLHVPIAREMVAAHRHVLVEKPLSVSLDGVEDLEQSCRKAGVCAALAYVLRFVPALQGAKRFLDAGSLGAVRHVAVNSGQHFPSYRPAYREIYYRAHSQGGGAIQDALTHLANAVEWIVGPATGVWCDAARQVLAGVDVEDTVNVIARHGSTLASYALNQFQAPNETRLDFHAEGGSVRVEMHAQRWGVFAHGDTSWSWNEAPVAARDHLFVAQAHAFLDACEGRKNDLCSLQEGIHTLRFNLAALRSWRDARPNIP